MIHYGHSSIISSHYKLLPLLYHDTLVLSYHDTILELLPIYPADEPSEDTHMHPKQNF